MGPGLFLGLSLANYVAGLWNPLLESPKTPWPACRPISAWWQSIYINQHIFTCNDPITEIQTVLNSGSYGHKCEIRINKNKHEQKTPPLVIYLTCAIYMVIAYPTNKLSQFNLSVDLWYCVWSAGLGLCPDIN